MTSLTTAAPGDAVALADLLYDLERPRREVTRGPATAPGPDAVLTRADVAAWLKLRPRQVERLGVPCLDLGRKTKRYLRRDVLAWLEQQRVGAGQ